MRKSSSSKYYEYVIGIINNHYLKLCKDVNGWCVVLKKLNFNEVATIDTCHFNNDIKHYVLNIDRIWHCGCICIINLWVWAMYLRKVILILL
jgi:hypothetical protein